MLDLADCRQRLADRAAQDAWDAGYYEPAQELLEGCVELLDVTGEQRRILELRQVIDERRTAHVRALLDAKAEEAAGTAGRKARRKELEAALAQLDPIRDEQLRSQVQRHIDEVDEALADGVWEHVWVQFQQLGEWALQLVLWLVVMLVLLGGSHWFKSKRGKQGIDLRLGDATEAKGPASAPPSPALAACFIGELRSLEQDNTGIIQVHDLTSGLFSGSGLTPALDDELSGAFNDQTLNIGPLRFSPQQLVKWFAAYWRAPFEKQLKGVLSKDGETYRFSLEEPRTSPKAKAKAQAQAKAQLESRDPQPKPGFWLATGATPLEAIRNVALQFAIGHAKVTVTQNWQSLRAYLQANEIVGAAKALAPKDRQAALGRASEALKYALQLDPSNWLARFRYGLLLGQLDDQQQAMDQFDYLLVQSKDWLTPSDALVKSLGPFGQYISHHRELPWMILYNYAVATAKVGGRHKNFRYAARAFEKWSLLSGNPPQALQDSARWYLDSLRALASVATLECLHEFRGAAPQQDIARAWSSCGLREIEGLELALWQSRASGQGLFVEAHTTAQYALGRAYFLLGRQDKAVRYLRWAIEIHVPEHAVDPRLALAEALLHFQPSPGWAEEARALSKGVLELRPELARAHYLLGLSFEFGPGGELAQAESHYKAAASYAPARLRLARVFVNSKQAAKALPLLEELQAEAARPAPAGSPALAQQVHETIEWIVQSPNLGTAVLHGAQALLTTPVRSWRPPA